MLVNLNCICIRGVAATIDDGVISTVAAEYVLTLQMAPGRNEYVSSLIRKKLHCLVRINN